MVKKIISVAIIGVLICSALMPILYIALHSLKGQELIISLYSTQPPDSIWKKVLIKPFYMNLDQYYEVFLKTPRVLYMFWNSMQVVIPVVVGQMSLAFFAAYGFSKLKFPGSQTLFFIYVVIMLMPFQVTVVPNYMMLSKLQLLDTKWALILPGIFNTFSVFFLKQFMEGIDNCFLEEARILGASEWQILKYVMLPISKPIIMSVIVFVFIDYWSIVEQPTIFLKDENHYPLSAYLGTINDSKIGIGFASSVLYMVLPISLAVYAQEDLAESFKITTLK